MWGGGGERQSPAERCRARARTHTPTTLLPLLPVMALVTWALFGIQEIGLWIEEPFQEVCQLARR